MRDSSIYALLGRNLWDHGQYSLLGEPHTRFPPLHPLVSAPFIAAFGLSAGIKLSTLAAGIAVLVLTFLLLRRSMSTNVALLTTLLVAIHPGFVLMSMLGASDLLFTAFFLGFLYAYLRAGTNTRWYLLAGLLLGLSCLTRYNGLPLFALYGCYALWKRREHLKVSTFWTGLVIGGFLFALWIGRTYLLTGHLSQTGYGEEVAAQSPNLLLQLLRNIVYYVNPVHNIFPFLFPFALYGLWRYWQPQTYLLLGMLTIWLISAVWWVQAIRFFFPGYPILLGFAALGLRDLWVVSRRWTAALIAIIAIGIGIQAFSLCIYTYGSCNSWFDKHVGILPKAMGLSSEGIYTWKQGMDKLNTIAESGATVFVQYPWDAAVWQEDGVIRPDLHTTNDPNVCPLYRVEASPLPGDVTLFATEDAPVSHVYRHECAPPAPKKG